MLDRYKGEPKGLEKIKNKNEKLVREFLLLIGIVSTGVVMVFLHYFTYDRETRYNQLGAITTLTSISSPSLSTSFYEPRLLGENIMHPAYPQMQPIDRMRFVYDR